MAQFVYKRVDIHYVTIEAETQEEADAKVDDVSIIDDEVQSTEGEWEWAW